MTAGYSGRPLIAKLGLKPGMRALIRHAPSGYDALLGEPVDADIFTDAIAGPYDFIQSFHTRTDALEGDMPALRAALAPAGMLWISWPKGIRADGALTETLVRDLALRHALVDVKVIAVDAVWSGLKLMIRRADR